VRRAAIWEKRYPSEIRSEAARADGFEETISQIGAVVLSVGAVERGWVPQEVPSLGYGDTFRVSFREIGRTVEIPLKQWGGQYHTATPLKTWVELPRTEEEQERRYRSWRETGDEWREKAAAVREAARTALGADARTRAARLGIEGDSLPEIGRAARQEMQRVESLRLADIAESARLDERWAEEWASAQLLERPSGIGEGGIGMANVAERLKVLYGENARMTVDSRDGTGTLVRLRLPVLPEDATHPATLYEERSSTRR